MAIVTILDHNASAEHDLQSGGTSVPHGASRDESARRQFVRRVSTPREPGHNQRVVANPPAKS